MRQIAFREALREAMNEEMRRDDRVFLMGEEVAEYNGAYKVSQGMLAEFGPKRVIDTPISELGFTGIGVGAAQNGLRPVIEYMTWNFAVLALDSILNTASKMLAMSGGQLGCPIVLRGPNGSAGQLGAQHSTAFENMYANIPGLKVVSVSNGYDGKGLLKQAIRYEEDPVIFMESEVKKTGTIGTIGTTSFYPAKNLGAYGDGGAIFTNDDALAQQLTMIANHGQSKRYYHDVVGCNSRLDTIQAAILNIRLKYLDANINARIKAADYYDTAFKDHPIIKPPYREKNNKHVFHQYTLILDSDKAGLREELSTHLSGKKIPNMIYYPVPGHKQKMFESFGGLQYDLPVTDWLTERVISLPIHPELDEEQLNYITTSILEFLQ